jgi:hypothetical protein
MFAAVAAVIVLAWLFMRGKRDAPAVDPEPQNIAAKAPEPQAEAPATAASPPAPPEPLAPAMTAESAPAEPPAGDETKSHAAAKSLVPAPAPVEKAETAAKASKPADVPAQPARATEQKPAAAKPAAPEPKEVAVGGEFDRAAAAAALTSAAQEASGCRKEGDPSGVAIVRVTFSNAGRATRAVIEGPPFAGTQTGGCIAATLRKATVPAYGGERVTVSKKVVIH